MEKSSIGPLRVLPILIIITVLFGASFTAIAVSFNEENSNNDSPLVFFKNQPEVKEANYPVEQIKLAEQENNDLKSTIVENNLKNSNFNNEKTISYNSESALTSNIKSRAKHLTFQAPEFQTEGSYSRLMTDELNAAGAVGDPELFTKSVTFEFKPGTKIKNVEFTPDIINKENLQLPLKPVQEPIPVSDLYDVYSYGVPDPTLPNPTIYSSSEPFPNDWISMNKGMGLDFDTGETTLFVTVWVYPVRYLPAQNEIMFITDGDLRIDFELPEESSESSETKPLPKTRSAPIDEQQYLLLIIGPDIFRQNLTRLAEYKNTTGLPAKFVSLNEINSGKHFPVTGVDQQEKIKYFIYNARKNWNISYVILGGDSPLIPHRFVYITGSMAGDVPADLYYADVFDSEMKFCDWDYDNDKIYGEYNSGNIDKADLYADVMIGRLPASNNEEIEVLVDKIINYESFTSGQLWYDNITMSGTNTFSGTGIPEGEYSCEYIATNYMPDYIHTKIYETTTYERDLACTRTNIVDTLNKGSGFATFHDHGAPSSWAGKFSSSDASALTNGDKLPFLNFDACSTGRFDDQDSITEKVVLNPKGGSITSIGASRIGWGAFGTNHINRNSGYFNVHLYEMYYNGEGTAGRIFTGSKFSYLDNIPISGYYDYMTLTEYILFGDPSLSVGGIPLKNINISCENNESYIMPSESVEYNIKITNNGTFSRPIKIFLSGIPHEWTGELNKSLVVVPPQGEKEIKLFVNASSLAEHQDVANVEVYAFYSQNKDRTISVMTKTITMRTYGMDLNITSIEDSVFPGEEASYWFKVVNLGNAIDTINLSAELIEPLPGWTYNFSSSKVMLIPYSTQIVTLKVLQPTTTYFGTYDINITGKIFGYSGDLSKDNLEVRVHILRTYGLKFKALEDVSQTFIPGEDFTYHFKIGNPGNYHDIYQLSVLMWPPSWNVSLNETLPFKVGAFSEIIKELNFEIPPQTLVGKYNIKVRAQSTGNYTVLDNIMLEVKINRSYGINVVPNLNKKSLDPGELTTFNFTIDHLGNDDDEILISVQNFPSKWYYNLTKKIIVKPFKSYMIQFEVAPHIETIVGEYRFQVKFSLMGNLEDKIIDFNISVNQIDGFELDIINNDYSTNAGESIKYIFFAKNLGNHEDEIQLNVTNLPNNWSISWTPSNLAESNLKLGAFNSKNDIFIRINTNSLALAGKYKIQITGKLLSTGQEIIKDLYLTINPEYGISLELDEKDINIHVKPGDEFTISINISNTGNSEDQITRTISGKPFDWIIRGREIHTFDLAPFEKQIDVIRMEVPDNETELDINFSIEILSESDPLQIAQERSSVHVEPETPEKPPETKDDWGDIETMFEKNFISVILPIIILIIVILVIAFLLIKQRKEYKEEMMREPEGYDEYYDEEYTKEAERLYGPKAGVGVGGYGRDSQRSKPLPRPPGPPPKKRQGRHGRGDDETMRWLDDTHPPEEPSMALCPGCGKQVSLEINECPYCGEEFEEVLSHDTKVTKRPKKRIRDEELDLEDEEAEDWDDFDDEQDEEEEEIEIEEEFEEEFIEDSEEPVDEEGEVEFDELDEEEEIESDEDDLEIEFDEDDASEKEHDIDWE